MKKFFSVLFLITAVFFFIFLFVGKNKTDVPSDSFKKFEYSSLFSEVVKMVKSQYVENVDPNRKFSGVFSSQLSSLDIFSSYLDEKKTKIYQLFQNGTGFNLGICGIRKYNGFFITDAIPLSPADQAGLQYGDMIKSVNGKSLFLFSFWEMYLSLQSEGITKIKLEYLKKGSRAFRKILLKTELTLFSPKMSKIGKNIFYVPIYRFDQSHVNFLKRCLANFKNSKWIIDLRRYFGGDFASFIDLTKIFIHKNINMWIQTKQGKENFVAGSNDYAEKNKFVFIINSSTILYSELLVHLLKSSQEILIGQETPGFIPKLKQFFLNDGSSILLTIGFFKKESDNILNSGVKPDIFVETNNNDQLLFNCISALNKL